MLSHSAFVLSALPNLGGRRSSDSSRLKLIRPCTASCYLARNYHQKHACCDGPAALVLHEKGWQQIRKLKTLLSWFDLIEVDIWPRIRQPQEAQIGLILGSLSGRLCFTENLELFLELWSRANIKITRTVGADFKE